MPSATAGYAYLGLVHHEAYELGPSQLLRGDIDAVTHRRRHDFQGSVAPAAPYASDAWPPLAEVLRSSGP